MVPKSVALLQAHRAREPGAGGADAHPRGKSREARQAPCGPWAGLPGAVDDTSAAANVAELVVELLPPARHATVDGAVVRAEKERRTVSIRMAESLRQTEERRGR